MRDGTLADAYYVEDPKIRYAIDLIYEQYGDSVSVNEKRKSLLKFGRHDDVDTNPETIMTLQGSETEETYATGNTIGYVASAAADTVSMVVEGHTTNIDVSGGIQGYLAIVQ